MKRYTRAVSLFFVCVAIAGCAGMRDDVRQFSTIDSLMGGLYDGSFSTCDLRHKGDFGFGTFDKLDGEMVLLDGRVYQAKADGTVVRKGAAKVPFAVVKRFSTDQKDELPAPLNFTEFKSWLDMKLPGLNIPYAVRFDGLFESVTVRSVPAQEKPYKNLAMVTSGLPVFERKTIHGTLVGFRFPEDAQGLNVAGYHFHFLSQDRSFGGHVLDLKMTSGAVRVDRCQGWSISFPDTQAFAKGLFEGVSSQEVKTVEAMPAQ